jgi:four helix bundle protein
VGERIRYHWELEVYRSSMELAMQIHTATRAFPTEERYSLTDQIRRSSRAVAGALAEGWRRRKYEGVFVNKINEAEGEGAETQAWLECAVRCGYLEPKVGRSLHVAYQRLLGKLAHMGNHPEQWCLRRRDP